MRPAGPAVPSRVVLPAPAPPGIPGARGRLAPAPGPPVRTGTLLRGPRPRRAARSGASPAAPGRPPRRGQTKQLPRRPSARASQRSAEAAGAAAEGGSGWPAPRPLASPPAAPRSPALQWAGEPLRRGGGRGRKGWSPEVLNSFGEGVGRRGSVGYDGGGGCGTAAWYSRGIPRPEPRHNSPLSPRVLSIVCIFFLR